MLRNPALKNGIQDCGKDNLALNVPETLTVLERHTDESNSSETKQPVSKNEVSSSFQTEKKQAIRFVCFI